MSLAPRSLRRTAVAVLVLVSPAAAQLEFGGAPLPPELTSGWSVPTVTMPAVDHDALIREDLVQPKGPLRFGVVQEMAAGLEDAGVWHALPDGSGRVWMLRVESPGAFSLSLMFADFSLTPGGELFVYDDARETVRGAYTYLNNKPNGQFAIQPIAGQALTLEYFEPTGGAPGRLRLDGVVHDYRNFFTLVDDPGVTRGGSCNVDVNCSQGNPWRNQIDSVVETISNGVLCSASLINNTANDGRQLLMSANHCGSMNNAVFRFNYQRSGCSSGSAPTNMTVQGSTLLGNSTNGDFRLMEIIPAIPGSYHAFYSGWNHTSTPSPSTECVHHPSGCPKKISFDFDPPIRTGIYWKIADWDVGTTEPGSSGSPLYDDHGRFLGQLCCGLAACGNNQYDEFGALNQYWSLVASILDPLGTGATMIDGFDPSCPSGVASVTARNGSGANPSIFSAVGNPVIGTSWVTIVDIVSQGASASFLTVALGDKTQGTFLNGTVHGEVLCQPPYLAPAMGVGVHMVTIPFDCSLVGRTICMQAATFRPGAIQLTNALDALIGSM